MLEFLTRRQHFGMPLHAQNETVAYAFDALDDAIFGDGVDGEPAAEMLDGLMMTGIHPYARAAHDFEQSSVWFDVNGVATSILRSVFVDPASTELDCNVLIEGAAQGDVDCLGAATNTKNR